MIIKNTYYIKRNDVYIWLSADIQPLETDEVIEIRPMLFADEGKILVRNGEEIGQAVWLKDGDVMENYIEVDEPVDEENSESEEENEDTTDSSSEVA